MPDAPFLANQLDADHGLLFCILLPLTGIIVATTVKYPRLRDGLLVLLGLMLFIRIAVYFPFIADAELPGLYLWALMPGLEIVFELEPLGLIFALVASFLWGVTTLYASGYMHGNQEPHQTRFYSFFSLAICAAIGIAFAGNLFTLFIFYELLTLSTYPLVVHSGTDKAKRSGKVYLGILLFTSIAFLLTAIIWVYVLTGTTAFFPEGILSGYLTPLSAGILLFLFAYGIGKAALMPIHRWLPAAMVAPTPVSALLHAVAVVKAGVFTFVKVIIYIFGADYLQDMIAEAWYAGAWLTYLSGATIVIASLIALRQDNLKRRLAYSTISQLSYVVMAASLLNSAALIAASFHIVAHAVGKITLFFGAGAIYTASKKTLISQLDGIGTRMPITMIALTIGSLSMIGIPPAVGFLSKYYLVEGAFTAQSLFALSVVLLSTLLNAAYFLPIILRAFFAPYPAKAAKGTKLKHGEAPVTMRIAMIITSGLTILLFFYPYPFLELAELATGVE